MRLLREPLAHFAALGALLFLVWSLVHWSKDRAPPPGTSDAISRTVTVAPADVASLRAGFRTSWKRDPDPGELADLVQVFISEEILFREGMALRLDQDDRVVRRRVIEKMTALARPTSAGGEPSRAELRRWYETYRHRFVRRAAVSFDQLFFDPQRPGGGAAEAAARALESLGAAAPADPAPAGVGDRSVLPARLADKSEVELAHLLGQSFAREAFGAPVGRWHGPVKSKLGVHLVRVAERQAERTPSFEEAEKHVRADWLTVETRGLRAAAESLLPRYEIVVPPDLVRQTGASPALAPFLGKKR
jgi:hypothetical protein